MISVAGATRLIVGTGGTTLEGDVYCSSEVIIIAGAFVPGQVLNFGNLTYIADCYGQLHPHKEIAPVGSESLASYILRQASWERTLRLDRSDLV